MDKNQEYIDNTIIRRVAGGDEQAFGELFRLYATDLHAQIKYLVKDDFHSKDILQLTFIKIWIHREKLVSVSHIRAYLKKIAVNETFNYLHILAKDNSLELVEANHASAATNNVDEHIRHGETKRLFARALETLPPQRRQIYELAFHHGLTSFQIGARLNVSPDYVRRTIAAARRQIRDYLVIAGRITLLILTSKIF